MNGPGAITPVPVPESAQRILLFGGSFDPPHMGHVRLAIAARAALGAGEPCLETWLVYVPAARSPHKPDAPEASDEDRLAMLRLATADLDRVAIWTDEIDRARAGEDDAPAPSYMIDTLRRARSVLRDDVEIRLLIGADQAVSFDRWREPRRIIALAQPVVMLREPTETTGALIREMEATGAWTPEELDRWARWVVPVALDPASATAVRAALHGPRTGATGLDGLLDERVLAYIERRGLYRDPGVSER